MREKNNILRVYFVGHPETGGFAVLAFNGRDAKRFVWNLGELDLPWIDISPRIIKDARMDQIKTHEEGHMLTFREGIRSGAYALVDGDECAICGDIDCEGCAFKKNWLDNDEEAMQ